MTFSELKLATMINEFGASPDALIVLCLLISPFVGSFNKRLRYSNGFHVTPFNDDSRDNVFFTKTNRHSRYGKEASSGLSRNTFMTPFTRYSFSSALYFVRTGTATIPASTTVTRTVTVPMSSTFVSSISTSTTQLTAATSTRTSSLAPSSSRTTSAVTSSSSSTAVVTPTVTASTGTTPVSRPIRSQWPSAPTVRIRALRLVKCICVNTYIAVLSTSNSLSLIARGRRLLYHCSTKSLNLFYFLNLEGVPLHVSDN